MSDEFARINELEEATDAEVNRDWLIEIDKEEDSEDLESKCYSIGSLFDKIVASNDDFGTVKIGTESTIRNESKGDSENMLPASIIRKLFNRTYNFNNNDIVYTTHTFDIKKWDTASVGNMMFHGGKFFLKPPSTPGTPVEVYFENVAPNPPASMFYSTSCNAILTNHSTEDNPKIFTSVPAIMSNTTTLTKLTLNVSCLELGVSNGTNVEFSITGWYFRDR